MVDGRLLTIAIVGPFSGPRSAYGDLLVNTVQDVIDIYPENSVNYVYYDDEAQPDTAEKVARTLIIEKKVSVVVGHFNSACAARVKDLYENAGLVFILPASTGDDLTQDESKLRFRLCASNSTQCHAVVNRFPCESAVVVSDSTHYGEGLARVLVNTFSYQPMTISNLLSLRRFEFSQVFIAGTHFFCAEVLNHLNQKRFAGRVIGCDDCDIPEFETLVHKPFSLYVMKLDKGFAYYIYNGLKLVLDVVCLEPAIDTQGIAKRLRQLKTPFKFSKIGDNELSQWKCALLEAKHD